ncbi:MAG TPA: hypothetical protein VNM37_19955, partial [Candidatus Dormibacteraeota bacterium]|nr:hypothetical protein [Candidatus Dormibacteraeota bacterium]
MNTGSVASTQNDHSPNQAPPHTCPIALAADQGPLQPDLRFIFRQGLIKFIPVPFGAIRFAQRFQS